MFSATSEVHNNPNLKGGYKDLMFVKSVSYAYTRRSTNICYYHYSLPLLSSGSPLVSHEHSSLLQESLGLTAPRETLNVLAIVSCI